MKKVKIFLTAAVLLVCGLAGYAQNITVSGVISDANGEPIPMAAVLIDGTLRGTTADELGQYSISAPTGATLVFSSVGYVDQKVPVQGRRNINVTLQTDSQLLDETIVVAFGTSTKEAFTGSAAVVKSSDIARTQTSDVTRSIEGLVPGVQMTTSSGTLGSSPSIRIRGISSISAGSAPLYVIDGIPYSGDMNNINPADIESITIQKDAASNALYGARGANGVIMITTKKAKAGDAVVNIDAKVGVNTKALQNYERITDPAQYYEAYYSSLYWYHRNLGESHEQAHLAAAVTTPGTIKDGGLGVNVYTLPEGELLIGSNGKLNPSAKLGRIVENNGQKYLLTPDDWMDEAYRASIRQEYNVSVSGTSGKASFLGSFGYLNDKGIIAGADMKRYTARLKADYQAKSWLKVGANFGYTNFNYNNGNSDEGDDGSTGNLFSDAFGIAPIYPLYIRDAQGNKMKDEHGLTMYDWGEGSVTGVTRPVNYQSNAIQQSTLNIHNSEGNAINTTGFAELRFLKDFKFTFNVGTGIDETRGTEIQNYYYGQFAPTGGYTYKTHGRTFYLNLQQILDWSKTFNDVHHLTVMLGHENFKQTSVSLAAQKSKLFSMDNWELNGAVIDGQSSSSSKSTFNTEGYFTRVLYDYDNRYFANVSYRRDASSRFHPDNRWGNFWAAGASWLINHESWFPYSWVDMLKLKASIGSQGNDSIGSYRYTDLYGISNNEGEIALAFDTKGNKDISWETNTNFNTGIDFELFGRKLIGSIEYFYRKTSDMLFFFTVPESLGYSGYYTNIGDMRNSGIELGLSYTIFNTNDLLWSVNANATHYKNKIIYLPDEYKTTFMEGYYGYASGNKFIGEGLPLNTFRLKKYAGIDHEDGRPMWYKDKYQLDDKGDKVLDEDGNPIITGTEKTKDFDSATYYLANDPTPLFYGGFGTSLEWKGFDFAVQFTYSVGGKTYDSGYARLVGNPEGTPGYSYHKDILNAWTPENKDSDMPRFVYQDKNTNGASDRFLVDASYLNIQNAQIGYTLPERLTRKILVNRLRIYVTCDNIYYWSHRKGLDPRYSFSGTTNFSNNSPVRTISGGINITF